MHSCLGGLPLDQELTSPQVEETQDSVVPSPLPEDPSPTTRTKKVIGFVSDDVTISRYASGILTGAIAVAKRAGYAVLIAEAGATPGGREDAVNALLEAGAEGLIVALMQSRMIDLSDSLRSVPTVVVNGASRGLHAVLPGEYEAGRNAAQHLLDHGHTRIGLIGRHWEQSDPYWSITVPRRFAGIDDVMAHANLTFDIEYEVSDWEPEMGYEGALEMLEASDITAIITGNDRLAFGVYNAANELGLSIPEDLSVVSFDNEDLAGYMRPGITTVNLPHEKMGTVGTRLLLDLMQGKVKRPSCGGPACEVSVPMQLVERESVARVKSSAS